MFYLGEIYRMPGVRMPLNRSDFSGGRGAFHAGVFGLSGAGKSVFSTYYIAGQLRPRDLGAGIVHDHPMGGTRRGESAIWSEQRPWTLFFGTLRADAVSNGPSGSRLRLGSAAGATAAELAAANGR